MHSSLAWTTGSGRLVRVIPIPSRLKSPAAVHSMLLSSDGAKILSCIVGRTEKAASYYHAAELSMWEADTGDSLVPSDVFVDTLGWLLQAEDYFLPNIVLSPALSPDGVWVVHESNVYNTQNGTHRQLNQKGNLIISSSFSPDGTLLGSGVWNRDDERWSMGVDHILM